MFKKIKLSILIFCISVSSHAYLAKTSFIIENKTDAFMMMIISRPQGQDQISQPILPQEKITLELKNGQDLNGWLYQTDKAEFILLGVDAGKLTVFGQGRVIFRVSSSVWDIYSFMDGVSAADGLKIEPYYSCDRGLNTTVFKNGIVIDGVPGNELKKKDFPAKITCQGLKSSVTSDDYKTYTAVCFNHDTSTFKRISNDVASDCNKDRCITFFKYTYANDVGKKYNIMLRSNTESLDTQALQTELDEIGNAFCQTWWSKKIYPPFDY